jgi:Serine dehydrogenase proteinase
MDYATRKSIYRGIEAERETKVITFVTSDRPGMETQIAPDSVNIFVDLLDDIGPTTKISLILHTNGGHTSAAWRIVNLIRTFCDELEVIIPLKAMSAGTLISLGADRLVMTKQAALGPIDPSLNHPLAPGVPFGPQLQRVPVSVEAVRGYLDAAKDDLGVKDPNVLATVLIDLSNKIHPLVLGEIFRSRVQIRFLADKLIRRQVTDDEKIKSIIDFLCADSGSHDYTINRREAADMGLMIEKPSAGFYKILKQVHASYTEELKLLEQFSPQTVLGTNTASPYSAIRGLVESTEGGCYGFLSEGTMTKAMVPMPSTGAIQEAITDSRTFEGWRKLQ